MSLQHLPTLHVPSLAAACFVLSLVAVAVLSTQEPDSKDNKFFLDTLYHDFFYKDIERRVFAHGVQVRSAYTQLAAQQRHSIAQEHSSSTAQRCLVSSSACRGPSLPGVRVSQAWRGMSLVSSDMPCA